MSYTHVYTWREGQVNAGMVRRCRECVHGWKISSTLRRKGGAYRLVFDSPTRKGIRFARHMFETGIAIAILPDDGQLDAAFVQGIRDGAPPLEHFPPGHFS